jgi:hypothetical protein
MTAQERRARSHAFRSGPTPEGVLDHA